MSGGIDLLHAKANPRTLGKVHQIPIQSLPLFSSSDPAFGVKIMRVGKDVGIHKNEDVA